MQLFLNSGVFTSLDAVSHWANRIAMTEGVLGIEQHDLIRFAHGRGRGRVVHYRMQLRVRVTDEFARVYWERAQAGNAA